MRRHTFFIHPIDRLCRRARSHGSVITLLVLFTVMLTSAHANMMTGETVTRAVPHKSTPHFLKDVAPILDKQGCSVGMCHGKFGGQGGFNLSLLTLNPESDYEPIVHHNRGRRISLLEPERSLFLLKPTGQVPHEGGVRFEPGSDEALTILRWIEAGVPFPADAPRLAKLEIQPSELVLTSPDTPAQLSVLAHWTDGAVEDVTAQVVYESQDPAVAEVSANGEVTRLRWGGTAILARYLGAVSAAFVTLPRETVSVAATDFPAPSELH